MNGELVDWADATVHVGVHGLHYGTGVFEGIRCYETPKGPAVFRLADHMQRLHDSARLLYMDIPFTVEELREATHDLIRANGLPASYLRPIAFYGYGQLGVSTQGNPVETVIMSWPGGHTSARARSRTASPPASHRGSASARTRFRTRRRQAVSTSTRCSRPPRRGGPATTRGSCSPTTATSPTARARTSS
jgi:branched-subunit amino acid aminotransferase/4-amino-4-deoxychorismate lyase